MEHTAFSTEIFKILHERKWLLRHYLELLRLFKEIKFIFQNYKYEWWLLMLEREKNKQTRRSWCPFTVFSFAIETSSLEFKVWRLLLKCEVSVHKGKSLIAFEITASEVYQVLKGWRVRWRPDSCQENFLSCINMYSVLDLYTVKCNFD